MEALVEWTIRKFEEEGTTPERVKIQIFCYLASTLVNIESEWRAGPDGPYSPEVEAILQKRAESIAASELKFEKLGRLEDLKNAIMSFPMIDQLGCLGLWTSARGDRAYNKKEADFDKRFNLLQLGIVDYNPDNCDLVDGKPNIDVINKYRVDRKNNASSDTEIWSLLMEEKNNILGLCGDSIVHYDKY